MRSKLILLVTLMGVLGAVGSAISQGLAAEVGDPADGIPEADIKFLPSTAVDASSAVDVFDVSIINPSPNPLLIDQILVNFSGSSSAQNLRARAKISGPSNPTFVGADSTLVFGVDPAFSVTTSALPNGSVDVRLGPTTAAFSTGTTANGVADLLQVAAGDTVALTLSVWSVPEANIRDGVSFTADILNVVGSIPHLAGIKVDAASEAFGVDDLTAHTSIVAQTAATVVSTEGDPGAVGSAVNVPSIATSRAVAVPVFQFKVVDDDDAPNTPNLRPTLLDGLTIPIRLGGGMNPADIAGASLEITSSLPDNLIEFSPTVGGDREINTSDDPAFIVLDSVSTGQVRLLVGLDANAGTADDGTADLLELADPGTGPIEADRSVVLTVSLWLNDADLTNNSTASFDLTGADATLDGAGTSSDVISAALDLADAVATIVTADNAQTTLSDRSTVPNAVTLPSSSVSLATAADVFDFFITDGIGGKATRVDSLTIPVVLSGGAEFNDLAGARLSVDNGAGIGFTPPNGPVISTSSDPELVRIDSVGPNLARISFRGRAAGVDSSDAAADLIEIPNGGAPVAFTLAVFVDTTDIAFGATFTFDLLNDNVILTGRESDGLAPDQDVRDGVASVGVTRLVDHPDVADAVTVSSAFSGGTSSLAVFDLKIVDPADGVPTLIDYLRLPIVAAGGGELTDIAEARVSVSGLSSVWTAFSGGQTSVISTADGDDADGGLIDILVLNTTDAQLEAGVGAGGYATDVTDTPGAADLLEIPDGESAVLTLFLGLNQAAIIDGSTLTFDMQDLDLDVDDQAGVTDVFAAAQDLTEGAATLRAATLADNPSVADLVYVSTSEQSAPGVEVFDFQIIDPPDSKPTLVDGIFIPMSYTGAVFSDFSSATVNVTIGGSAASIPDDAAVGGDDDGAVTTTTDASVVALVADGIEIGSDGTVGAGAAVGNGDGTPGFFALADGETAVVTVRLYFASTPALDGESVAFDLQTAHLAADTQPGASGGIAAGQDVPDGTLLVTAATTQLYDGAPVGDAANIASTTTATPGTPMFDFIVQDLDLTAGGTNDPTDIDGITIPITLSGMEVADIGGFRVTATGAVFVAGSGPPVDWSDTDSDGDLETGTLDKGIFLDDLGGGRAELLLGGSAPGITANTASGGPELIAADDPIDDGNDDNPLSMTVSMWLSTSNIDDNATVTFNLNSEDFLHDLGSDKAVPHQTVTPSVATVRVSATELIFTAPASGNLAADGISDSVRVAAVDINDNLDVDYVTDITISTSTGTGEFSEDGAAFLGTGIPAVLGPAAGSVALLYRDTAIGPATVTATSPGLIDATFDFTVAAFTLTVDWNDPPVGGAETDSAGTYHKLLYNITTNDPNLRVEFWASQLGSLPTVDDQNAYAFRVFDPDSSTVLGKLRNPTGAAFGPGTHQAHATDLPVESGVVVSQHVYTSALSEGDWYVYVVKANGDGVSAGGDTLSRSGPLAVLHGPDAVAFGITEARDATVDDGTSFARDSGGNEPNPTLNLLLYAQDHNSNDDIELYISTNASLDEATVQTDETAYRIGGTTAWRTADVADSLRYASVTISDSLGTEGFHPRGTYYFYARIPDPDSDRLPAFVRARNLSGQQQSLAVNHSPSLVFSEPAAPVVGHSVADSSSLMIAWNGSGVAGDHDVDDNAAISLWLAPHAVTPTAFADTVTVLTRIVSGLQEDPDGGANDQFAWDLTDFDGLLPAEGDTIKVWALLDDGGGTPVYVATEPMTFAAYQPLLRLLGPPPGAATDVKESDTFRFPLSADHVSSGSTTATLRFLISSLDGASASDFVFDSGGSSTFPGNYNAFWISGANEVKEGVDRFFDWSPKDDGNDYASEIVPLSAANSTFYVYAVVNTTGAPITSPSGLALDQAPGRVKITGIGTTLQDPAVSASPSQVHVAAGDTVRVLLRGHTNNTPALGVQLYVNLDSTKFEILDQDASTLGVQPFGHEAGYAWPATSWSLNQVQLDPEDDTTYKLDLEIPSLAGELDPTGEVVAHLDLVARAFAGTAEVNWNLDTVNDPDRIPLFYNVSGQLGLPFSNPLVTFAPIGRGSVSGFVPLQGGDRTSDAKTTTFWLRVPGSWVSISDTVFFNANDTADDTVVVSGVTTIGLADSLEGVQVRTGADGSFVLTEVPPGVYELVAKSESYLAGFAEFEVVNGQAVSGIVPTGLSAGSDPAQLLGGDLDGNNKIDGTDASALQDAYRATPDDANYGSAADIDDDGHVFLSDLLILAANLQVPLLAGVEPVYKPAPGVNEGISATLAGVPLDVEIGQEFVVALDLDGAGAVRGYTMDLVFDAAVLELVQLHPPELESGQVVRIERFRQPGQFVLAAAQMGPGGLGLDGSRFAGARFRALQAASEPMVTIDEGYIADATGRIVEVAARVERVLPERTALWPNAPNPFNPATRITFDVARDGAAVELTVYNLLGQPVRRLIRADAMRAGRYTLSWDGRDDRGRRSGTGVYLYGLRAGDTRQVRRMTLAK